jgi:hypothetical protein
LEDGYNKVCTVLLFLLLLIFESIQTSFFLPSFLPCTVGNKREEGRTESGRGRDEERREWRRGEEEEVGICVTVVLPPTTLEP